ncbi:MAG: DUF502 domain-containing protein, partial [Candidatus Fonsibacter sp.]
MKSSIITKLRNYFLAGIVTLIPIFITVYLTIVVIDLFSNIVPNALNPNKYLPFKIPGLEILIALVITIVIGMISLTYFGKKFILLGTSLLEKIPVIRSIYSGVTQFTKSFQDDGSANKKVVLIEFPRPGAWAVGFATNETGKPTSPKKSDNLTSVFIPTTPNPTSGFLILVPKKDL